MAVGIRSVRPRFAGSGQPPKILLRPLLQPYTENGPEGQPGHPLDRPQKQESPLGVTSMFAIYRAVAGSTEWRFVKAVSLARLLVDRILEEARVNSPEPDGRMPWGISGPELRNRVVDVNELDQGDEYKLVIDATYKRRDASLFEICHVWGYADPDWSPLALRLSHLCELLRANGAATPIEQFEPEDQCDGSQTFVHEFLYLQHGHQRGTQKNWGRMGYTNAALLWPPHLDHLLGKMGFSRTA